MTTTTTTALEALVENCRRALGDLLSRVAGAPCEIQVVSESGPLPGNVPVCLLINAEGAINGPAAILMDQRSAGLLATKMSGAPAARAQAVQELLRQTVVLAVGEFQKQFGATRAQLTAGPAPSWQPQMVLSFLAGNSTAEPVRVQLLLSQEIAQPASQVNQGVPAVAAAGMDPLSSTTAHPGNLHLVMGVEVEVTLRFGQRKLPLRQLVELNAGSVVELDKRVHEPVELLLRDRVFARGEVVIVEGHYGLRVTEVCATAENL